MKYFSIPMEVTAIQVPVGFQVLTGDESLPLDPSDWLVFEADGSIRVYDNKDFKQRFCSDGSSVFPKPRKPRQKKAQPEVVEGEV